MKMNKIGAEIKRERKKAGLTQKELADRLDVTQPLIGQYERGVRNPKPETIQKIAEALHIHFLQLAPVSDLTDPGEIEQIKKDFANYVLNRARSTNRIELAIGSQGSVLIRIPEYTPLTEMVKFFYQFGAQELLANAVLSVDAEYEAQRAQHDQADQRSQSEN